MRNLTSNERIQIEGLKSLGHMAEAISLLKQIRSDTSEVSVEITSELCHLYVKQSRYSEAYEEAQKLEELVHYPHVSFARTLIAALLLAFRGFIKADFFSYGIEYVVKKLVLYPKVDQDYQLNDGLLWGVYWQNMRKALKMNVYCVLSARTRDESVKSFAFLYYTLAFLGHSVVGLAGLRRLIKQCEQDNRKDLVRSLLTWLGVAYQMGGYAKECLQTHDRLAKEFPQAEPFHQIISYASQLNMSISELGPEEVRWAADRCFSISFALQESRNHIQIYCGKAALLALEGREIEALSFLERAEKARKRNNNTLDNLIFHRLASVTFLNLKKPDWAFKHLAIARENAHLYAPVAWYKHEIARIHAIASAQQNPALWNRIYQAHLFLWKTLPFFNWNLVKKSFRLYVLFVTQSELTYWPAHLETRYLKKALAEFNKDSKNSILERVTLLLTKTILNSPLLNENKKPSLEDLKFQVSLVFQGAEVIGGDTLSTLLNKVRIKYGLSSSFIHNEENSSIRASCGHEQYFIGVQTKLETEEKFAIGVVIQDIDVQSHEIVEVALRILLTLFVAKSSEYEIRKQLIINQKRAAIASIATLVAHDIRGPLTALEAIVPQIENTPEEVQSLLTSACQRIRDIAGDLLNTAKELNSENNPLLSPQSDLSEFPIDESILKIVAEKKSTYPKIEIRFESSESLKNVRGDKIQFQRIISNILDNAVEALRPEDTPVIGIAVRGGSRKLSVYVKDHGRGIPLEVLQKLGTPGFSFGKASGNGFGLSFAKSKIEEWGGQINILSKENTGTMVTLTMPVVP